MKQDTQGNFGRLVSKLQMSDDGVLSLNTLPMILLPRHFICYIARELYSVAGPTVFQKVFWKAGHDGAVTFCRRFQKVHECGPREAVEGYLKEMTLRGWGRFRVLSLDVEVGNIEVLLENSALTMEDGVAIANVTWEGALAGSMNFLQHELGMPAKTQVAKGTDLPVPVGMPSNYRISVESR